jgi:hypothetical protein
MASKIGNGSIPLRIGRLIDTTVYGGPYRDVPVDYWGVKMAVEIKHPHMVAVDTKDFDVPKVSDLKAGIVKALMAMINEEDVYAGCMGGIGRTGLFLAALAKVQIEYRKAKHRSGRGEDPVLYVRKHFIPHAVETAQQEKYIADLDVSDIVQWLDMTQTAMGLGGLTPAKTVEVTTAWVKPEWIADADKIGDPSFDNFKQQWKERQHESTLREDLASDETLWEDNHTNTQFRSQWNRMDDMQAQIDELTEHLDCSLVRIEAANQRIDNFMTAISTLNNRLTNSTIAGKIRRLFS